jgi:hypothetical protein
MANDIERRRAKAALDEISQLWADNSALTARTQQFLSGELP